MPGRTLIRLLLTTALLGAAACGQAEPDEAAPATAATLPESTVEAGQGPEPSIGAPPPEGGGVPGAAEDYRAGASPETSARLANDPAGPAPQ